MSSSVTHNLTTEVIYDAIKSVGTQIRDPVKGEEYMLGIANQKAMEQEYVTSHQMCPIGIDGGKVAARLSGLNPAALKAEVQGNFYNVNVMEAAACIAGSIALDRGEMALSSNERIREFVTDLRQIGSESVSGYALSASLGDKPQTSAAGFFVVKAPRSPTDGDELVHECTVAFMATNKLRHTIPNFAYIYGLINCSPPFIDSSDTGKKDVVAWCNSVNGAVSYAIYENIAPAKSFAEFCRSCTLEEFMKYYLQAMLACRTAADKYGFTHYDAHGENVLIRKVRDTPFYIPYETSKGTEYIKSDGGVATFIDFGMSHIQMTNDQGDVVHFGHVSNSGPLVEYGVYRDRPNPIHDAYKLLCMCMYEMCSPSKTGHMLNPKCFNALGPLLKFFNTSELPADIIAKQRNTFYFLPWNDEVASIRLDDWIDYCRQYLPSVGIADPITKTYPVGANVLACNGACLTFSESMSNAGVGLEGDMPIPSTHLEFYDSFASLASRQVAASKAGDDATFRETGKAAADLANKFRATKMSAAFDAEVIRLDGIVKAMNPFVVYSLPTNYLDLLNPEVLRQVKNSVTQCVKFLDAHQRLLVGVKAGRYIQKIFRLRPDDPFVRKFDEYEKVILKVTKFRNTLADSITKEVKFLEPWRNDTPNNAKQMEATPQRVELRRLIRSLERDPQRQKYRWYWMTYPSVASML